jgi:hypothetical protein
MKRFRLFIFPVLLFFVISFPLKAESVLDRLSLSFRGSILYFPEDNGIGNDRGDNAPVLPSPGAAVAYNFWGPLSLELSEDLYFTNYAYSFTLNRAVPVGEENRSAFVFGFFTGLQVQARFPLTSFMSIRPFAGVYADLRAVVLAADLHPDDLTGNPETDAQIQTDAVRGYFWDKGRWVFPGTGVGLDFAINEKFLLGLDLRMWFPIYKLGKDEALPPVEGWRFGGGFKITIR